MSANPTIRTATHEDTHALAETIRDSFRDVADRFGLTIENCPAHPSNCTTEWVERDMNRGITYFILEANGVLSGCAAFERVNPTLCYLERLTVLPHRRRRGFGKALVNHVLAEAQRLGAHRVSIAIIADHTELKTWYQQAGFVERQTKRYPHLPFRATFMSHAMKNRLY